MEVDAKVVVLKNLDGEYLVPYVAPYTNGTGINITDNVVAIDEETLATIAKANNPAAIIREW